MNGNRILSLVGLALAVPAAASAAMPTRFDRVVEQYEVVRAALAGDAWNADAVAAAQRLHQELAALASNPSPEAAAVPSGKLPVVASLLPELDRAAGALAAAKELAAARDAFYRVSMPLVRWRSHTGRGPGVAYCSMAKRSWLQPAGKELGNPYLGRAMAKCGQIVG